MPRKLRKSFVELPNAILFLRISRERVFQQPRHVGVEKVRDRNVFPAAMIVPAEFFFSPQLRGGLHGGGCRLAEEADESLEVLGSRRQEELLPHKP